MFIFDSVITTKNKKQNKMNDNNKTLLTKQIKTIYKNS